MKHPLLQKRALDAFLQQLNDPEVATHDPRTDKEFEHPYGSKGTESEGVKYGAQRYCPYCGSEETTKLGNTIRCSKCGAVRGEEKQGASSDIITKIWKYFRIHRVGKVEEIVAFTGLPYEEVKPVLQEMGDMGYLRYHRTGEWQMLVGKVGATWGIVNDILHPDKQDVAPPPAPRPSGPNICSKCGRGMTRMGDPNGKTEMVCTHCKYAPKTATKKPKCPHCGSSNYGLMPSDFETAKCGDCGKNWNHGIVKGINGSSKVTENSARKFHEDLKKALGQDDESMKQARKPMYDDSGATTGLRSRPDYGESDSYTTQMNEKNKSASGIKWRVDPPAVGRYRSFERRAWPSADYANGDIAITLHSEDEYIPSKVKTGEHAPITVRVADWGIPAEERGKRGAFVWRKLKGEYPTLKAAQTAAAKIIAEHPELHPAPPAPVTSSWKSPLLRRRVAAVEIHETPRSLPPRDDMRRHLDKDIQKEIDLGVDKEPQEGIKVGDDKQAGPLRNAILPAVALMGLGGSPSAETTKMSPPAIVRQQKTPVTPNVATMDEIVNAIARAEGAKPERHNPGNIVDFRTGKIKTFATDEEGEAALRDQLKRISEGNNPNFDPDMSLADAGLVYSNGDPNWAHNVSQILRVSPEVPFGDLIKGMVSKKADDDGWERGLEMRDEFFNDQADDARNEARMAFMEDPDMQEDANSWGMTMEEFWQKHGEDYANEYWEGRTASKKAMKTEEGTAACPKCSSSNVEEVTNTNSESSADGARLYECSACAHLFAL